MKHNQKLTLGIALLALLGSLSPAAWAQSYTSRSSFLTALPGAASTLNFDAVSSGTTFASGTGTGGITFTYSLGSVLLKVTAAYPAVSGANALGSSDADILQDGDNLTLAFTARHALGVAIITKEALQNGDLTLTAGGVPATISAGAIQQTLGDGSNVYFLGVIRPANAPFTTATLTTVGGGYFFYNLDDLVTAVAVDTDGDGMSDNVDNCSTVANNVATAGGPAQLDTNGDGYGNRCDPDITNDGVVNINDLNKMKNRLTFVPLDHEADLTLDGVININDINLLKSFLTYGHPGPSGLRPLCVAPAFVCP